MTENIKYKSENIEAFYKKHRVRWADFYESERIVFERLSISPDTKILDIGCGCAGLGLALKEKFGTKHYTGIEINEKAAQTARSLYPEAIIIIDDVMNESSELKKNYFDLVVSLGAIDWNIRFRDMLIRAYQLVKPEGYFLASYRLTDQNTIHDIKKSYQYVNFEGKHEGEKAPYVVTHIREMLDLLKQVNPAQIMGYGYWGKPSATAVTPFEQVCFAVIAIQKPLLNASEPIIRLDLPLNILQRI